MAGFDNEYFLERADIDEARAPKPERAPRQPRPDSEQFVEEVVTAKGVELRTVTRHWQDYIA